MRRKWIGGYPTKRKKVCVKCEQFFARFKCNAPDECDCPKCQGMCSCATGLPTTGNEAGMSVQRLETCMPNNRYTATLKTQQDSEAKNG